MKTRRWVLVGIFAALGLTYIIFFTEWLRPVPIEVVSQIRFSVQNPHFGRAAVKKSNGTNVPPTIVKVAQMQPMVRLKPAGEAPLREADGDVAHVSFSLDDAYRLTHLQVEDVPVDGTSPKTLWLLKGKSVPLRSLIYGRDPEGMVPVLPGSVAEPLKPGVPYRLVIEAGRHRGTNTFTTVPRISE
jgi:hypothetical protein